MPFSQPWHSLAVRTVRCSFPSVQLGLWADPHTGVLTEAVCELQPCVSELHFLAPSRRRFPIVKLSREEYLKTVRGFTFKQGIPNLSSNAYDFRWVASQRAGAS